MASLVTIAAAADPEGLRDQWYEQQAARRARVAEAIASFGTPESTYALHIRCCEFCLGGFGGLCAEGEGLFHRMMGEREAINA